MKKAITVFCFLFFFTQSINAQEWLTDINEAQKIASEKNQKIILVFQGSDWCAPCIKLDTEIWSTPEFITYSKEHYTLLKADFPRKKKNMLDKKQQEKNNQLAEKYNTTGFFPYVVVLDKNAQVLGSIGYKKVSPAVYIDLLNSF